MECNTCHLDKPDEEFHWRSKAKGIRIGRCKACRSQYSRDHYQRNKPMYLEKAKRWDARNRKDIAFRVEQYLLAHPCVDCGETDPIVLTFDHVRGIKSANIADMVWKCTWQKVSAEIAKCDVRCANCHLRKTAERRVSSSGRAAVL